MANTTITNDKRAVFIDVTDAPHSTHSYKRMGEGINTFTPSNNGQISTKHYINDKFATSRRNGLQKQFAFSGDRVIGDAVNDYLVSLSEETGTNCETTVIIADLITPTSGNKYKAKKYDCMIDISNDGAIEGGQDVTIDGTLYINGDPTEGFITITADEATWSDT